MKNLHYKVRYHDGYGNLLSVIDIDTPPDGDKTLHLTVAAAGNKAFGDFWGKAVVIGNMRLTVDGPAANAAGTRNRR